MPKYKIIVQESFNLPNGTEKTEYIYEQTVKHEIDLDMIIKAVNLKPENNSPEKSSTVDSSPNA